MSSDGDHRGEFERDLFDLIVEYRDSMGEQTVVEVLRDQLVRLGEDVAAEESDAETASAREEWALAETEQSSQSDGDSATEEDEPAERDAPDEPSNAQLSKGAAAGPPGLTAFYDTDNERIELVFATVDALESRIDDIVQFQGLMVSPDASPPALADVEITFAVEDRPGRLEVTGRAFSQSGASVALQFEDENGELVGRFESFVEDLRSGEASGDSASQGGAEEPLWSSAQTAEMSSLASREATDGGGRDRDETDRYRGTVSPAVVREPDASWSFDERSITVVLAEAARKPGPGIVEVQLPTGRAELRLNSGRLFDIERIPRDESRSLGRLLMSADRLDEDRLDEAQAHADRRDLSVAQAIRNLDLVPYEQLVYAMKSRVVLTLEDLLEVDEGRAEYYSVDELPENYFHPPVNLLARVFDHLFTRLRETSPGELEEERESLRGKHLRRVDDVEFPFDALDLDELQSRFVERSLAERRTLDQLYRESPIDDDRILALLSALAKMGALDVETLERDTLTQERSRDKLDLLYRQSQSEDLFEKLNLHWTTYEREVEQTVEELHDRLDAIEEEVDLDSQGREKLAEARREFDRARSTLIDRSQRQRYREERVEGAKFRSSLQIFEDQLETLTLQRKPEEIVDRCRRILELEPDHEKALQFLRRVRGGAAG